MGKSRVFLLGISFLIFIFQNCNQFQPLESMSLSSLDGRYSDPLANPALACSTTDPGQTVLRRLNKEELANSLKDILEVTAVNTSQLPADTPSADGFSNNATFLKANSVYLYELINVVEAAVTNALNNNPQIFSCGGITDSSCATTLVKAFGRKAFRRTLKDEEVSQLVGFVTKSQSSGLDFKNSVSLVYQRILLSPNFLFRTSFGNAGAPATIALLTPHEYVTRIAFFIWNSPPDEELLKIADQDGLRTADAVKAQVTRMLKDSKALRFNESFVGQWIGTTGLPNDFAVRTSLPLQTQRDMRTETESFVAEVIRGGNSPLDLIAADYSFLNENLANHYGIAGVTGSQFRKVSLASTPRRGLLTQGAFLTLTSSNDRTKPTGRGNSILQNITCTPPPPFPDGLSITPLDESDSANLTVKQQLERHNANPSCAACHREMDPVGLGFENFDQTGKYRTTYSNGLNVDSSGVFHSKSFNNSADLLNIIKQEDNFKRCLTKKLMTYALGRSLTSADSCALSKIGVGAVQPDKSFVDLIVAIVLTEQFRMNHTESWGTK